MFDLVNSMKTAAGGMSSQSYRLRIVSENMANADTPGFQRKTVSFANEIDRATGAMQVRPDFVSLDQSDPKEVYEPNHPLANERGLVTLSNVNTLIELADAREAQRSYQANLSIFDQARRMHSSTLDLLRR
ncbi:MAG: flagellar basal body rod protein FlgC [Pseudomonadota bacterium]